MNKEGRHQISNVCFKAGVPREAADSQEALLVLPWLASLTTPHPLPLPFHAEASLSLPLSTLPTSSCHPNSSRQAVCLP